MGSGNAYYGAFGTAVGFTYNIGETLGINMPSQLGISLDPGTVRQTLEVIGLNTRGAGGGTDLYHEESVGGAVFTKILAPGQSVTIYSQWWVTLYENKPMPLYTVIHGNMAMKVKVYNNGAYL